jgi:hypothetical protein
VTSDTLTQSQKMFNKLLKKTHKKTNKFTKNPIKT